MSPGDPPVYLFYGSPPAVGEVREDPTHTSSFGVKLKEKCERTGIPCELVYPGMPDVRHPTTTAYLIATLKSRRGHARDPR